MYKKTLFIFLILSSPAIFASYHVNFLWGVRPFCTSPGFVIPVLEKLAIGPMYSTCEIDTGQTNLSSSGLGGVVLYSLSNLSIYDEGLILAVNFFSQQSSIDTDLGSTASFNDLSVGSYLGYQFLMEPGFSFWGGLGLLSVIPSLVKTNIAATENQNAQSEINDYVTNSFKISPTLMIGWIF
jgi:hypothetical protein